MSYEFANKIRINAMLAVGRDGSMAMKDGMPWMRSVNLWLSENPLLAGALKEDMAMFHQTMSLPNTAFICGSKTYKTLSGLASFKLHPESKLFQLSSTVMGQQYPNEVIKTAIAEGFTTAWVMGGLKTYESFAYHINQTGGRIVIDVLPFTVDHHVNYEMPEDEYRKIKFGNLNKMFAMDLLRSGDEDSFE